MSVVLATPGLKPLLPERGWRPAEGHGGPPTSPGREIAVVSPDCNRTRPAVFTAVREAAGCPHYVQTG